MVQRSQGNPEALRNWAPNCSKFQIDEENRSLIINRNKRANGNIISYFNSIKLNKKYEFISKLLWKFIQSYSTVSKASWYFCMFFFLCSTITLFVYKYLIIVAENFQKYHLIQRKKTQPVVVTREWNKLLWTSKASYSRLNLHIHLICIQIFNNYHRKMSKNTIGFSIKRRNPLL